MAIAAEFWLDLIGREYLETFIPRGGAAVRFVVADAGGIARVAGALRQGAASGGMEFIALDLAETRLHMLQDVVFAIARALPWDRLMRTRLQALVTAAGYAWPDAATMPTIAALAETSAVAAHLLRRDLSQALSREIWADPRLTLDFRAAMTAWLDATLQGDEAVPAAAMAWLDGSLRGPGALKQTGIGRRIGRQNARGVLMSLCAWVRQCGVPGIVLLLDIRRLHLERREVAEGLVYTPAAVMDCYEVLRQMIDDAEHFPGLFLAVLAGGEFLSDDPRRSLGQYTALQMRVWDDVRPRGGDNPLAPLVRLQASAL